MKKHLSTQVGLLLLFAFTCIGCGAPEKNSATVTSLNADRYIGSKNGDRVNTVAGPKAAQAAFEAAFGPSSGRPSGKVSRRINA